MQKETEMKSILHEGENCWRIAPCERATHIRWSDFAQGSAIGLAPGVLTVAVFADGHYRAIRDPGAVSWAILASSVLAIATGGYLLRRWLRRGG